MAHEDIKYSHCLESFLHFLQEAQYVYSVACNTEREADSEQQDIVHEFELGDNNQMDYICLGIAERNVRQKRRRAKDEQQCLRPLMDWIETHNKTIKELEQTLGKMRKAEKETSNRYYHPRTNIVKNTLVWKEDT